MLEIQFPDRPAAKQAIMTALVERGPELRHLSPVRARIDANQRHLIADVVLDVLVGMPAEEQDATPPCRLSNGLTRSGGCPLRRGVDCGLCCVQAVAS